MNKATLLNALDNYLAYIQIDSLGDITPKINAIVTCRDLANSQDSITENFVKSNFMIIFPAITFHRQSLNSLIKDADRNHDEKKLAKYRAENELLQSYFDLLKPFHKFLR